MSLSGEKKTKAQEKARSLAAARNDIRKNREEQKNLREREKILAKEIERLTPADEEESWEVDAEERLLEDPEAEQRIHEAWQ